MLRKLSIFTLTIILTLALIVATQNLLADKKSHKDGYETRTAATGGQDRNRPLYRAWADYNAKLRKSAKVDKVKGNYNLVAFVAGGSNPKDLKKKYTMKKIKIFGVAIAGDQVMKHHYSVAQHSSSHPPYAYATAAGGCGSLTNKTEKWRSSAP